VRRFPFARLRPSNKHLSRNNASYGRLIKRFEVLVSPELLRNVAMTGVYLIANPREFGCLPRWLRERKAATMALRQPWWPYAMVDYLDSVLPHHPRVFEYGGGGSSLWLCDRGASVTIVEHEPGWSKKLQEILPPSAEVVLIPPNEHGHIASSAQSGYFDQYVKSVDSHPDGSFDLVIVDGRARVDCVFRAKMKLKIGGYLLLDDSDRARYQAAIDMLSSWPSKTIRGLKAGSPIPASTTVWMRPN